MYYIKYFFFYSILGHFIESIIYLFESGESSIMYGYWTPIYGIGTCLIIYLYNQFLKKKNISTFKKYLLVFIIGFVCLTIIEWIGGILIEITLNKIFWNYSDLKFNIGKYIALEISTIWGLASVIVIYVKKYLDKLINKIPNYIPIILIVLFLFDIIFLINKFF